MIDDQLLGRPSSATRVVDAPVSVQPPLSFTAQLAWCACTVYRCCAGVVGAVRVWAEIGGDWMVLS
jgi:hypothetical protein